MLSAVRSKIANRAVQGHKIRNADTEVSVATISVGFAPKEWNAKVMVRVFNCRLDEAPIRVEADGK